MPYIDTKGKLTIGVGFNLTDRGGLPSDVIDYLLHREVYYCDQILQQQRWYQVLDDTRKQVLISMVYNMGWMKFQQFKKTIAFLVDQNYDKAAEEMLDSDWARQVKERALRLSQMMKKGIDNV